MGRDTCDRTFGTAVVVIAGLYSLHCYLAVDLDFRCYSQLLVALLRGDLKLLGMVFHAVLLEGRTRGTKRMKRVSSCVAEW